MKSGYILTRRAASSLSHSKTIPSLMPTFSSPSSYRYQNNFTASKHLLGINRKSTGSILSTLSTGLHASYAPSAITGSSLSIPTLKTSGVSTLAGSQSEPVETKEDQSGHGKKSNNHFMRAAFVSAALLGGTVILGAHAENSETIDKQLIKSAKNGDLETLKDLLTKNPSIYSRVRGKRNRTLMLIAAREGQLEVVQWLLDTKIAQITEKDERGNTAFLLAAMRGRQDLIIWLLAQDKNLVRQKNKDGLSALLLAASKGKEEIVDALLKSGASLEESDKNGNTAFLLAVMNGYQALVGLLLAQNKALLAQKNKYDLSALLLAAGFGEEEIIELLLRNGATLAEEDNHGNTAFLLAAQNGHRKLVGWLLNRNKSLIAKRNKHGQSALLLAAIGGQKGVIDILLKNGASLQERDKYGNTVFLLVAANGHVKLADSLSNGDSSLGDQRDNNGNTAFLLAAGNGHVELVDSLLNRDKSLIEQRDNYGNTAFLTAAITGRVEIVDYLLNRDKSLTEQRDNYGHTAFLAAAANGQTELVGYLLGRDKGLITQKSKHGLSALFLATAVANTELAEFLLSNGADHKVTDIVGRTPLHVAAMQNNMDLWDILIKYGADQHAKDENGFTPQAIKDQKISQTDYYTHVDNKFKGLKKDHDLATKEVEDVKTRIEKLKEESKNKEEELKGFKDEREEANRNDTHAVVEHFSKILTEKLCTGLYMDKAIYDGLVKKNDTTTIENLLKIISITFTSLSGDVSTRIAIQLATLHAQGQLEENRRIEAAYVEVFPANKSIVNTVSDLSEMIAKRYRNQLLRLSVEGLEDFADYFYDKIIQGLKDDFNNKKRYFYSPPTKIVPVVRKIFEIAIDSKKGKSIPLRLRKKDEEEQNRNKTACLDSRELLQLVDIQFNKKYTPDNENELKQDNKTKVPDKQSYAMYHQPAQSNKERDGREKYGFCYGDQSDFEARCSGWVGLFGCSRQIKKNKLKEVRETNKEKSEDKAKRLSVG